MRDHDSTSPPAQETTREQERAVEYLGNALGRVAVQPVPFADGGTLGDAGSGAVVLTGLLDDNEMCRWCVATDGELKLIGWRDSFTAEYLRITGQRRFPMIDGARLGAGWKEQS